jgi:hypothetical protein
MQSVQVAQACRMQEARAIVAKNFYLNELFVVDIC